MPIAPGQSIPSHTVKQATPDGGRDVDPSRLFAGKHVVLFSLPGAFTPTCSSKHLPSYLQRHDELARKGVDLIACLSVNDSWVMQAWAEQQGVGEKIVMLADGDGSFTRALGLDADYGSNLGTRARRSVIVVKDGVVERIDLEERGKFEVSGADACLLHLG
jgi:glutaredoxin/glutathione-dependent peroxiredoxin